MTLPSLEDVILVALAVLAAAHAVLRVVAPLTRSTADDRALRWVVRIEQFLAGLFVPGKYREAHDLLPSTQARANQLASDVGALVTDDATLRSPLRTRGRLRAILAGRGN